MTQEIVEAALAKSGLLVFKELQRFFPTADPEDYIAGGAWNDELLKLDLQLFEAHRREAGADDPLDLEAVPDVSIPPTRVKTASGMMMPTGGRSLLGPGGVPTGLLAGKPLQGLLAPGVLKPQATAPKPAVSYASGTLSQVRTIGLPAGKFAQPKPAATATASPAGAAGDSMLRQVTLFNTKWQINPLSTKRVLERLSSPARRRYVMLTFTSTSTGDAALAELEQYITQCEQDNQWGGDDEAGSASAPSSSKPAAQAVIAKAKVGSFAFQAALAKAKAAGLLAPKGPKAGGLPRPIGTPAKAGAPAGILSLKRPVSAASTPTSDAAKRPRLAGLAGVAPQAPVRTIGSAPAHATPVIGARAPMAKLRPLAPAGAAAGTALRPTKLAANLPPVIRGPVRPGVAPSSRPSIGRLAAGAQAASARLAISKPRPY
mmetsp:Transcript_56908/g.127908  ORF Transcript_56908/g.127908 Transcript_56908/m.127908 type:complete len:431 (-) Transcript_56908:119-1411(-)